MILGVCRFWLQEADFGPAVLDGNRIVDRAGEGVFGQSTFAVGFAGDMDRSGIFLSEAVLPDFTGDQITLEPLFA
ncbi:MAG: hypothetical protein PUC71_09735 [Oscillospiraceae bacterium]|nr:hypothetical protein [Oscillospiraceae bacterium]